MRGIGAVIELFRNLHRGKSWKFPVRIAAKAGRRRPRSEALHAPSFPFPPSRLRPKTMVVGVGAASVVCLAGAMYFTRLAGTPFSGEETRRAQVAREMAYWNDWVVPRQQGAPLLSRPPLHNWTIALAAWLHGQFDEISTRAAQCLGRAVVCRGDLRLRPDFSRAAGVRWPPRPPSPRWATCSSSAGWERMRPSTSSWSPARCWPGDGPTPRRRRGGPGRRLCPGGAGHAHQRPAGTGLLRGRRGGVPDRLGPGARVAPLASRRGAGIVSDRLGWMAGALLAPHERARNHGDCSRSRSPRGWRTPRCCPSRNTCCLPRRGAGVHVALVRAARGVPAAGFPRPAGRGGRGCAVPCLCPGGGVSHVLARARRT